MNRLLEFLSLGFDPNRGHSSALTQENRKSWSRHVFTSLPLKCPSSPSLGCFPRMTGQSAGLLLVAELGTNYKGKGET